jgi:hypothetical protein
MAIPMSTGPLDELVELHDELGILTALGRMKVQRQRRGLATSWCNAIAQRSTIDINSRSSSIERLRAVCSGGSAHGGRDR